MPISRVIATLVVIVFTATACSSSPTEEQAGVPTMADSSPTTEQLPEQANVRYVQAEDMRPSQTFSDWVTYADYVVVGSVKSEQLQYPTKTELETGNDSSLRDVRLSVEEVLWSNPKATTKLPKVLELEMLGVAWTDDGEPSTPLAQRGVPRMEVGHRYIWATFRHAAVCSGGDDAPAFWNGLGADALLPYDKGMIGYGETAGSLQTVQMAKDINAGVPPTVESAQAGKSAKALALGLSSAEPHPNPIPRPYDPACG